MLARSLISCSALRRPGQGRRWMSVKTAAAEELELSRVATRKPRRAVFNVPGSDDRKIQKATTLDLDVVVLDYEDGVAHNKKVEARKLVVDALQRLNFGRAERAVRINAVRSGLEDLDLESLKPVLRNLDSILLPKTESAEDVQFIDKFLTSAGDKEGRIKILAAIESAASLLNLKEICEASNRVDALIFASEDYSADVGVTRTAEATELLYARSAVVTHAAAYKISSVDMVCIQYKDPEQLARECKQGYEMGFDGKQAIHPNQIQTIYQLFSPPAASIELATRIVVESRKHFATGVGAWEIDGKMIDAPMIKWAHRILQRANVHV